MNLEQERIDVEIRVLRSELSRTREALKEALNRWERRCGSYCEPRIAAIRKEFNLE